MTLESRIGKTFWFDLPAANLEDARSFYEGLFHWQFLRLSDDAIADYWAIQAGGELIGGLRRMAPDHKGSAMPILYFTVADLPSASQRVRDLGGNLVGEPVHLGKNRGSYQWFQDREKNCMALWAPSKESV